MAYRQPNGRFSEGNPGGPGHTSTLSSKVQEFRRIFISRLSSDYVPNHTNTNQTLAGRIIDRLLQDALAGDKQALKTVVEHMIGKPQDPDIVDALKALQILQQPLDKLIDQVIADPAQRQMIKDKLQALEPREEIPNANSD